MLYRNRLKLSAVFAFGDSCYLCGKSFPYTIYEIHHMRDKTLSFGGHNIAIDTYKKEIKKCLLLCPNCHRMVTQGYIIIPSNLKSNFNESLFDLAFMSLKRRERIGRLPKIPNKEELVKLYKKYTVSEISKLMGLTKEYTINLFNLYNIKFKNNNSDIFDKHNINREDLKNLIRYNSFTYIGRIYGVTDNAVRKWCKKYNLPYRRNDINKLTDDDWKFV